MIRKQREMTGPTSRLGTGSAFTMPHCLAPSRRNPSVTWVLDLASPGSVEGFRPDWGTPLHLVLKPWTRPHMLYGRGRIRKVKNLAESLSPTPSSSFT